MKRLVVIAVATLIAGQAAAAPAPPAAPAALEPAVAEAVQNGFKACAPALDRFVKFIADGAAYDYIGTYNAGQPDGAVYNLMMAMPVPEGESFASVSAVRSVRGKCDVTVVQVVVDPGRSCVVMRETDFKAWKSYQVLSKSVVLQLAEDNGVNAILTPVTDGCQVVIHAVGFAVE